MVGLCAPSVLRGPVCKKTLFWMSKGFVCVFVCVCLFCVCGLYGPVCVEGTNLQKDNPSDEQTSLSLLSLSLILLIVAGGPTRQELN